MSGSTVIVLDSHNVVFSEIIPALDFNKNQNLVARILNPMRRLYGNIDSVAGSKKDVMIVQDYFGAAGDGHPVFRPTEMFLIAQAFSGQHFDTFDFISGAFVENRE